MAAIISHIVLWTMVLVLSVAVVILARQVGLLHQRLTPSGARLTAEGPEVGDPAPAVSADDQLGRPVTLGSMRSLMTLLLFVSPRCPACDVLIPSIRSLAASEQHSIETIVVSLSDDSATNSDWLKRHELGTISFVQSRSIVEAYGIQTTPHAVLVGVDGLVKTKGMVNHREHLESLLTAAEVGHPTIEDFFTDDLPRAKAMFET